MDYVYLASVEHSGSTLLACLLGAHTQVTGVGEFGTPFPKDGNCACGVIYRECPFWSEWGERARAEGIDFDLGNLDINLTPSADAGKWELLFSYLFPDLWQDRLRDILFPAGSRHRDRAEAAIHKSDRLAAIACGMEGTEVFLDTTKNPFQVRHLAENLPGRTKLISLVRDGRGVMNSLIEKEKYSPEQAVSAWLWGNRNLDRVARYLPPEAVFRLRLEDLCADPDGTWERLCEFLGVDPAQRPDHTDRSHRHVVGNRMRHSFDGAIRHDEKWRTALSPEHLALFEEKAGDVNRRYGYGD